MQDTIEVKFVTAVILAVKELRQKPFSIYNVAVYLRDKVNSGEMVITDAPAFYYNGRQTCLINTSDVREIFKELVDNSVICGLSWRHNPKGYMEYVDETNATAYNEQERIAHEEALVANYLGLKPAESPKTPGSEDAAKQDVKNFVHTICLRVAGLVGKPTEPEKVPEKAKEITPQEIRDIHDSLLRAAGMVDKPTQQEKATKVAPTTVDNPITPQQLKDINSLHQCAADMGISAEPQYKETNENESPDGKAPCTCSQCSNHPICPKVEAAQKELNKVINDDFEAKVRAYLEHRLGQPTTIKQVQSRFKTSHLTVRQLLDELSKMGISIVPSDDMKPSKACIPSYLA